ncbi:MAG TPA: hypothetical protein VF104_10360, partial [Burkholderiales bacterium]
SAKLGLLARQTTAFTLTDLKVTRLKQTCTNAVCTANFTVTFTAPTVAAGSVIKFNLFATDTSVTPTLVSAPQLTTVTVNPLVAPTVNPVTPLKVLSGAAVSMPVTVTTPNTAANVTLSAVQTTAFTLTGFKVSGPSKTCTATLCKFNWTVSFTAPALPLGQVTPDVIRLTLTATDVSVTPNLTSAPESTFVNVTPIPDTITITSAEYRTGLKQRLIINATSSVVSPNVVLRLQPYLTTAGTLYDPCPPSGVGCAFQNTGGGLYIITVVGAPEPAIPPATPLDVKSNLQGDSGSFALTLIR